MAEETSYEDAIRGLAPQQAQPQAEISYEDAIRGATRAAEPQAQRPQEVSYEDAVAGESPGVLRYGIEAGKQFGRAAIEGVASSLRGIGAQQAGLMGEAGTPQRPVTEAPIYQAGESLSQWARETLPDRQLLNPIVADIIGGFGSLAGNIAPAVIPVAGVPLAVTGMLSQGMGEAAERAVQAGATPEQQVTASRFGSLAGATEFADLLIPKLGSVGAAYGLVKRVGMRALAGFVTEGGQEGLQQGIQNLIAAGVYDPTQDIGKDVPYSALIGGIVGGVATPLLSGTERKRVPATEEELEAAVKLQRGQPTGAVPSPAPPPEPPPATLPRDPGAPPVLSPVPQAPTPNEPVINIPQPPVNPPEPVVAPPAPQPQTPQGPQLIDLGFGPLQAREDYAPATGGDTAVNAVRAAALLGGSRYAEMLKQVQVSLKELLQNAYDAIKPLLDRGDETDGNIDINMYPGTRTIEVKDDGKGMDKFVMTGPFLELAGTKKDLPPERSSGGFGIAKMLPFYESESLFVRSMRDGVVTEMTTSGPQLKAWLADPTNPQKKPVAQPRKPTSADRKMFPKGHGTLVRIITQKEYPDPRKGNQPAPLPFEGDSWRHEVLRRSPLFANINVTFNGDKMQYIGSTFKADQYVPFANVELGWGTARLYMSKDEDPNVYGNNVNVLSAGIWQFSKKIAKDPTKAYGDPVPHTFYLDIASRVRPEEFGYPFDLNRQNFVEMAEKDFQPLFNFVSTIYRLKEFQNEVKNFGDVQYLIHTPSGAKATKRIKLEPRIPPQASPLANLKQGGKVEIKDGVMTIGGKVIPITTPEEMAAFVIDFKALKIDPDDLDFDNVMLHDNVDVKISASETRSLVEWGREKFGDRFNNYVFGIGNLFKELRDVIWDMKVNLIPASDYVERTIEGRFDPVVRVSRKYHDLRDSVIGVSFDIEYLGVSTSLPMRGQFINPAFTRYKDPVKHSTRIFTTMVHEIAHFDEKNHDVPWRDEFQSLLAELDAHPTWSVQGFKQRMIDIVHGNPDIASFLREIYSGTFTLSPRGKRFEDSTEQTGDGSVSGSGVGLGQIREGTDEEQGGVGSPTAAVGGEPQPGGVPGGPTAQPGGVAPTTAPPGTRISGTSPRQLGINPRALGTSPRQLGQSPRQLAKQAAASAEPKPNVKATTVEGSSLDNGLGKSQEVFRKLDISPEIAVPQQPETQWGRKIMDEVFAGTPGGTPLPVKEAAGHADRMNKMFKWTAGIKELKAANPRHVQLSEYDEILHMAHREQTGIIDGGTQIIKAWRRLGEEGDRLAVAIEEVRTMSYRTPGEVAQQYGRHPSDAELKAIWRKHKLSPKALLVYAMVKRYGEGYITMVAMNIIDRTKRSSLDPLGDPKVKAKEAQINAELKDILSRPYFAAMRFGRHYVMVKDPKGHVTAFYTFEREGLKSAEAQQMAAYKRELAEYTTNHPGSSPVGQVDVVHGVLPAEATALIGMPKMLLEELHAVELTPRQLDSASKLALAALLEKPAILSRKYQRKYYVPGHTVYTKGSSLDMRRSFGRWMFHGAKYYTRTKYKDELLKRVISAEGLPGNKEGAIAEYMRDHLFNNFLDARGDFGTWKAAIFLWTMGYVPAAATQNLAQIPMITYPWMAARFGGIIKGDTIVIKELIRSMASATNYYKRATYDDLVRRDAPTDFEIRALQYGVKSSRITEAQASELAGLTQSLGLIQALGGNKVQQNAVAFMEKAAFMFEMAEQFNRRVTYRAALRLAMKYPNALAVKEALSKYKMEYAELVNGVEGFTPAQAAAVVTAAYTTEATHYVYAQYGRPRIFRGPAGVVLVFQRYLQATGYMLANNWKDVFPRYLLIALFMGGMGGFPGMEDLKEIVKALSRWRYGKDFDIEKETRKFVIEHLDGAIDPDLVAHGAARRGMGFPALLDMLGSFAPGGVPGRGWAAPMHDAEGRPQGFARNVPFPVTERSRALTLGHVLPFSPGALLNPTKDINRTIAEQGQRASGAVFSVGFNVYKAIMNNELEWWDRKRWDTAVPRALGATSAAFRSYNEGRERTGGGPAGGTTVVNYDPKDTEQMMELIAQAMGYNTLRKQARWDLVMQKVNTEAYYDLRRQGLLSQFFEAWSSERQGAQDDVIELIQHYNASLPPDAQGKAISRDTLKQSVGTRERGKILRELGESTQKGNVPIGDELERLYPESTINVRRVR